MSTGLLDVNVLVALFDPSHINHEEAHGWFGRNAKRGWATCAVTISGFVRVVSNPAYPSAATTPGRAIEGLRTLCAERNHIYWGETVSLLDERLFRHSMIPGHQKITDTFLLGMAVRHAGKLVTFDRSIPAKAVIGSESGHMEVLGSRK